MSTCTCEHSVNAGVEGFGGQVAAAAAVSRRASQAVGRRASQQAGWQVQQLAGEKGWPRW